MSSRPSCAKTVLDISAACCVLFQPMPTGSTSHEKEMASWSIEMPVVHSTAGRVTSPRRERAEERKVVISTPLAIEVVSETAVAFTTVRVAIWLVPPAWLPTRSVNV